jgi:transposase
VRTHARAHVRVVLLYDELLERNRSLEGERRALEALLRAGRDRARDEREKREALEEEKALALRQLEELRRSHAILQQEHELLRHRIFEAKAERVDPTQLEFERTMAALDELQQQIEAAAEAAGVVEPPAPLRSSPPSPKLKPRGRRKLDETSLPIEKVVLPDPEMQALVGRGEAEIIGADVSSTMKYRRGSMARFVTEKPTYRAIKNADGTEMTLVTAVTPPTVLARSIGTPSLYAHIAKDEFDRGLPLYRQEEEFADLGVSIDRGTMSRWLEERGGVVGATVLHAMRVEALASAMCLSTDATGILVQQGREPKSKARRLCKKGHFVVQIADRDAVFFEYTERETSAAVLEMFRGFSGDVQAEAKTVYDVLFRERDEPPTPTSSRTRACAASSAASRTPGATSGRQRWSRRSRSRAMRSSGCGASSSSTRSGRTCRRASARLCAISSWRPSSTRSSPSCTPSGRRRRASAASCARRSATRAGTRRRSSASSRTGGSRWTTTRASEPPVAAQSAATTGSSSAATVALSRPRTSCR